MKFLMALFTVFSLQAFAAIDEDLVREMFAGDYIGHSDRCYYSVNMIGRPVKIKVENGKLFASLANGNRGFDLTLPITDNGGRLINNEFNQVYTYRKENASWTISWGDDGSLRILFQDAISWIDPYYSRNGIHLECKLLKR